MTIDNNTLSIAFAFIGAVALTLTAYLSGRRRQSMPNGPSEAELALAQMNAYEKQLAGVMYGPHVTRDDVAVVLHSLTGLSVSDATTSSAKTVQAIEALKAIRRQGLLLKTGAALYKQCPHLLELGL